MKHSFTRSFFLSLSLCVDHLKYRWWWLSTASWQWLFLATLLIFYACFYIDQFVIRVFLCFSRFHWAMWILISVCFISLLHMSYHFSLFYFCFYAHVLCSFDWFERFLLFMWPVLDNSIRHQKTFHPSCFKYIFIYLSYFTGINQIG